MYVTELIIGDRAYRLPPAADEETVLSDLTEAVRAGGGVVELPATSPQSAIAVLISPGVPVFIERTHIPEHPDEEPETDDGNDPTSATDWF